MDLCLAMLNLGDNLVTLAASNLLRCGGLFWEGGSSRVFPKIGVPQNGWFTMKNHIKMDDLGVPLFLETSSSQQQTME